MAVSLMELRFGRSWRRWFQISFLDLEVLGDDGFRSGRLASDENAGRRDLGWVVGDDGVVDEAIPVWRVLPLQALFSGSAACSAATLYLGERVDGLDVVGGLDGCAEAAGGQVSFGKSPSPRLFFSSSLNGLLFFRSWVSLLVCGDLEFLARCFESLSCGLAIRCPGVVLEFSLSCLGV